MARTKYKAQFCSYCNKESRMEIGVEMQGVQDKVWYRCTRCHHMSLIDLKIQADGNGASDTSTATTYSPGQCFKVGESIFHSEWNDTGRVLSKTRTSDGSESILVMFQKEGERRLITNLKPETSDIL
jgi:hypothetical protein